jgi:hypothetical protein
VELAPEAAVPNNATAYLSLLPRLLNPGPRSPGGGFSGPAVPPKTPAPRWIHHPHHEQRS